MNYTPGHTSLNSSPQENYSYSPLVTTETQETVPSPSPKPQPTSDELCMMQRAARGVIVLSFAQLTLSVFYALSFHGILLPTATALFAFLGICGAARKNCRLLIAHFIYSLVLYILSLVALIMFIIYCEGCSWWFFGAGFLFILLQAIGMRHSRILIGLLGKYNNGCQGSSWCSRKCRRICSNTEKQVSTPVATQTPVPFSTETSTQTQNQVQIPIPQFVFPQPVDFNNQQAPMFPYASYYMRYPVMIQPPVTPPNENMYSGQFGLPQMYKQV